MNTGLVRPSSSKRKNTGDVLDCNTQALAGFTTGHCRHYRNCSYNPTGHNIFVKQLFWAEDRPRLVCRETLFSSVPDLYISV
jgi:hypothetical protein